MPPPEPLANLKLQHLDEHADYRVLAPPLRLFDFPWATCEPPSAILASRTTTPPLKLRFSATGTLNCFAVHFTLDLDGNPENCISSGRENLSSHWEQNARWLPVELAVRQGHELSLEASHSDHHLRTLRIPDVRREHVPANAVGHEHLIGMPIMQDAVVALDWAKR